MLDFQLQNSRANPRTLSVADPKQDEGFKVVDRRLFTDQGELRKDVAEQEQRDEEAAARKAASASQAASQASTRMPAGRVIAPGGGVLTSPLEDAQASGDAEQAADETVEPSRSFQMLVDLLTRNAAAMLGGMADPRTGQAFVDLEGAREVIDMLDVLREKTRANLAKADEDLLIEVIGSLKLTYMEIAKAAADHMSKKTDGKK
jgi:hypothetical protein